MSGNNQGNFINFINHLLTFNKQHELLKKQTQNQQTQNQQTHNNILPFRFNINSKVIIKS